MRIRTDFPGGNGKNFEFIWPCHLKFTPDNKGGRYSLWFHFIVEDIECETLFCEMEVTENQFCWPYKPYVRPVYRILNEDWKRVSLSEIDNEKKSFYFKVPCRRKKVEVAFCYPYQISDWKKFLNKNKILKDIKSINLGKSQNGRDIFLYELGDNERYILLTARCHSGETPGSYVLEGIILEHLSNKNPYFSLKIIPFLDIDGVEEGMYGKERFPVDFYTCWRKKNTRKEVKIYGEYLQSLKSKPLIAIDCHAPTPNDPHYLECSTISDCSENFLKKFNNLIKEVIKECNLNPITSLDPNLTGSHPDWFPEGFQYSLPGYLQKNYGTFAFTVESSYNINQGIIVGPAEWRLLGKAIYRGINTFVKKLSD